MEDNEKYGLLLNSNIKLHRQYFREMCRLLGINVLYRAPLPNKHYTRYAEIESNYAPPIKVGCIFDEHPTQQTLKKIGWMAELDDTSSIIHVDYDLPNLQQGALFIIPSGLDDAKGRLFRVSKLTNSIVYPASVTCEIVPEYEDIIDKDQLNDFRNSEFNAINEEHQTEQFLEKDEHIGLCDVEDFL